MLSRKERTQKRHRRLRKKLAGTAERPRMALYKSNKHFYVQFIDDENSTTIHACSTLHESFGDKNTWSTDAAKKLGEQAAKSAVAKGIKMVVFDRGGLQYHGKISAFADSAREHGLGF